MASVSIRDIMLLFAPFLNIIMSKKKVSLSNRKRLSELQQPNEAKTAADVRREQIQSMQQKPLPEATLDMALERMINDIVLELIHNYEKWSAPLDRNRYRFSPNERRRKLLVALKGFLNEVAGGLASEGIYGNDCLEKCQKVVDRIAYELRKKGVSIGTLQLHQSSNSP